MNVFALAFLGGMPGAVLMDNTETALVRVGIRSGADALLAGPLSHIPYGLGVGAALALGGQRP